MKRKEWLGWHFLPEDRRIASYGYGTQHGGTLVVPGQTLALIGGVITPCLFGFHTSKKPLDALRYASGSIVQRVSLSGDIVEQADKAAARERTCVWLMDASLALHICAVHYAELALDRVSARGEAVDPRSRAALTTKLLWLRGKASGEELAAARAAAWDAARDAARAAAWAAARDAAWAAARDAAWDAAWDAARDAARAAARAAARDAEQELQNAMLEAALFTQFETGHGVFKLEAGS